MTDAPRTVPAGAEVALGAPSFPPHPALVDRLRTFVRQHRRVGAVYVFGMRAGEDAPVDVVAATIVEGEVADHASEVADLQLAVVDVLPADATVDLTIIGQRAELDLVGAFAPVGAGGPLEVACARAWQAPDGLDRLLDRVATSTLLVPAMTGRSTDRVPPGLPPAEPDTAPRPRPWEPGEPVQWPLVRHDGHEVVSVFSSWPALLHADPPFPDQLLVPGRALLDTLPAGVGLAVDPGCLHAVVLPASELGR